ncbi:uncharacterized protein G2W53_012098 [Senna tora]|uniref:Uncharacterized protein n=1 Tax=Senna tora TaxID=362788 RepID=A0A834U0Z3_9FABA|nr:uncharacterized protein G2W53_012098 [Senna tora]
MENKPPSSTPSPPPPPPPTPLQNNPSIDYEPRTLSEHEINLAREAAIHIMNTHTKEEALKIFLAGLVPVTISRPSKEEVVVSDGTDDELN